MSIFQNGPKLLHTGPNTWQGVTNAVPDANQIYLALQSGGGGYIPYVGSNYILVDAVGTDYLQNGTALKDALTDCYALTPNGDPLSSSNRAVLFLFPGYYYLDTTGIEISEFVDIIGIGNPADIIIGADDAAGTIQVQAANDYQLKNFTIINDSFGANAISIDSDDFGIWDNLILQSPTSEAVQYRGTYTNLECQSNYVLQGDILGTVSNCIFAQYSCGYSFSGNVVISGIINNCRSNGNSFGSAQNDVIITGTITNCTTNGGFSFGASASGICDISGRIENCTTPILFGNSFCYSNLGDATLSGSIINCVADGNSFVRSANGSTVTSTGIIRNCTVIGTSGQSFCFTSDGNSIMEGIIDSCNTTQPVAGCFVSTSPSGGASRLAGIIKNCSNVGGYFSFVGNDNAQLVTIATTGVIDNCISGTDSFCSGSGTMENSGWIKNCTGTTNCFGDTLFAGRLTNCRREANFGNHSGIIEYCYFFDPGFGYALMVWVDGARIRYCTIIAIGGLASIGSIVPATPASIYQCSMNLPLDATVTNDIAVPYNVIDPLIIR